MEQAAFDERVQAARTLQDWQTKRARAAAKSPWRPMHEAKKTARPVLLLCSGGPLVGQWSDAHGSWITAEYGSRTSLIIWPSKWMAITNWKNLP